MASVRRNKFFLRLQQRMKRSCNKQKLVNIFQILDGQRACVYCGSREELTIDHVIPVSRMREFKLLKGSRNNRVIACKKCNLAKSDMTPKEAGYTFQPWVRRRTWLIKKYNEYPIPVQTPNGLVCLVHRTKNVSSLVA